MTHEWKVKSKVRTCIKNYMWQNVLLVYSRNKRRRKYAHHQHKYVHKKRKKKHGKRRKRRRRRPGWRRRGKRRRGRRKRRGRRDEDGSKAKSVNLSTWQFGTSTGMLFDVETKNRKEEEEATKSWKLETKCLWHILEKRISLLNWKCHCSPLKIQLEQH